MLLAVLATVLLQNDLVLFLFVEDAFGLRGILERVHRLLVAASQLGNARDHHCFGAAAEGVFQEASQLRISVGDVYALLHTSCALWAVGGALVGS